MQKEDVTEKRRTLRPNVCDDVSEMQRNSGSSDIDGLVRRVRAVIEGSSCPLRNYL